ncbi:MAG: dihydroorotate dehydrogenase electron transfer subunit [Candidatus Omnitrophica bacterium]|nr:dihydroorotate dehydrogenase electron transfer subunit [Candidatus Omnitrophota bacterium]
MARQLNAKILENARIKGSYFRSVLLSRQIASHSRPGQFLNIKVSSGTHPLLRRPLSIHGVDKKKGEIRILYEVVGRGSEILSQQKSGGVLDIIGPLGHGFDLRNLYPVTRNPILVAGGMGVAPLFFLAETLGQGPRKRHALHARVLIGGRTKEQILCENEFKSCGCRVEIATDDGSRGFKGKVTELLERMLRPPNPVSRIPSPESRIPIYACGPRPMLREISRLASVYHISAQLSLEEHMSCGIGACLGCVVKTRTGYQRVCKEGPVFNAEEIVWEKSFRKGGP